MAVADSVSPSIQSYRTGDVQLGKLNRPQAIHTCTNSKIPMLRTCGFDCGTNVPDAPRIFVSFQPKYGASAEKEKGYTEDV